MMKKEGVSATFKSFDRGLPKVIFHLSSDPGFFQDRVARRKKSPEDWKTGRLEESGFSIFLILGLILSHFTISKMTKISKFKGPPLSFFLRSWILPGPRRIKKSGRMEEWILRRTHSNTAAADTLAQQRHTLQHSSGSQSNGTAAHTLTDQRQTLLHRSGRHFYTAAADTPAQQQALQHNIGIHSITAANTPAQRRSSRSKA